MDIIARKSSKMLRTIQIRKQDQPRGKKCRGPTSNSCQVGEAWRQCVLLGFSYLTLCPIILFRFCPWAPAFYTFLGAPPLPLTPHGAYVYIYIYTVCVYIYILYVYIYIYCIYISISISCRVCVFCRCTAYTYIYIYETWLCEEYK